MLKLIYRIGADRTGGATILTVLGTIAVIGMSGLTIDGARALYVHERLVSALDAAALAGARVINTGTANQYQSDAAMYFHANFPNGYLGTALATADPAVSLNAPYNTTLTIQQSLTVPSTIMRAFGSSAGLTITGQSVVQAGKVELAMVLDNTGSMAEVAQSSGQSKIAALQAAATQLVDTLTANSAKNVRISIVPYNTTVNVGSKHRGEDWIDPTAQYIYSGYLNTLLATSAPYQDIFTDGTGANYQQNRFDLFDKLNTAWAGCVEARPAPYDVQDDAPTASVVGTQYVPFFAPDELDAPWHRPGNKRTFYHYPNSYLADEAGDSTFAVLQGDYRKYNGSPTESFQVPYGEDLHRRL